MKLASQTSCGGYSIWRMLLATQEELLLYLSICVVLHINGAVIRPTVMPNGSTFTHVRYGRVVAALQAEQSELHPVNICTCAPQLKPKYLLTDVVVVSRRHRPHTKVL